MIIAVGDFAQLYLALRSHDMLGHARGARDRADWADWAHVLCCASQTSFATQKEVASSSRRTSSSKTNAAEHHAISLDSYRFLLSV